MDDVTIIVVTIVSSVVTGAFAVILTNHLTNKTTERFSLTEKLWQEKYTDLKSINNELQKLTSLVNTIFRFRKELYKELSPSESKPLNNILNYETMVEILTEFSGLSEEDLCGSKYDYKDHSDEHFQELLYEISKRMCRMLLL